MPKGRRMGNTSRNRIFAYRDYLDILRKGTRNQQALLAVRRLSVDDDRNIAGVYEAGLHVPYRVCPERGSTYTARSPT